MMTSADVPGYRKAPNEKTTVWINGVGPDYFSTLGTPLLAGRAFTDQDGRANKIAIVNEKTAALFWPHENPIGKRIAECEVIGVVKDAKYQALRDDNPPTMYQPLRQSRPQELTLHVRVSGSAAPVISGLSAAIRDLDRNLPVYKVTTMEAQLDNSIALDRLLAMLTAIFGLLAVVLAGVGLYGVMAYAVSARTHEIGIRMALGADRARVLRQIVWESALLIGIGVALGIPATLWASRAIATLLYGLNPTDPLTYAMLAGVLMATALGAAWIPAYRASRVDPMVALRYQ
jgi:predicted permease